MDTLSRLLALFPIKTRLDLRCQFKGPWMVEHEQMELGTVPFHIVMEGSIQVDAIDGKQSVLNQGDIIIFPQGGAHRLSVESPGMATATQPLSGDRALRILTNAGNGPASDILCGEFRFEKQAASLLRNLPDVIVVHSMERRDFSALNQLMSMLRAESDSMLPGAGMVISSLSSALFTLVIRVWMEQGNQQPGLWGIMADRRLLPLLRELLTDPAKPWTMEQMAQTCNMSRATFARVFQSAAAMTPALLLLEIRMAQAKLHLEENSLSTPAVAEAVGYQSEAAFGRAFKRYYGIGPGEFRRKAIAA